MSEELLAVNLFDILTQKRSGKIKELINAIPKPKNAIIESGLPLWNHRDLNTKLPMIGSGFTFTRGKLGEPLWQSSTDAEFSMDDPHSFEISNDYEPLHDKNLRTWFARPSIKNFLIQQNLLTPDYKVKCDLKSYNQYRKYMNRLHSNTVNIEQEKREVFENDRSLLQEAQNNAIRDFRRISRAERMQEYVNITLANAKQEKKKKADKCINRLKRIEERYQFIQNAREEDKMNRREKGKLYKQKILKFIADSKDCERKRKIETLKRWRKNDLEKQKRDLKENEKRKCLAKEKEMERWNKKFFMQNLLINKEAELSYIFDKYVEIWKEKRNKIFRNERKLMEEELAVRKILNEENSLLLRRNKSTINIEKVLDILFKKSEFKSIKSCKNPLGVYGVLFESRKRAKKIIMSEGTKDVIESILIDVLENYIKKLIEIELSKIKLKIIEDPELVSIIPLNLHELMSVNKQLQKTSIFSFRSNKSVCFDENLKEISMEMIDPDFDPSALKRTSDRPPTPVPSLLTITDIGNTSFSEAEVDVKYLLMRKIAVVGPIGDFLKRVTQLIIWNIRKIYERDTNDKTPIITKEAMSNRKEITEETNVSLGLAKVFLKFSPKKLRTKRLSIYVNELTESIMHPVKYKEPFKKMVMFNERMGDDINMISSSIYQ